jgi:membrane associated rhomboid family serine protease
MVSLYFFGREIGRLFGGVRLLQLYVAGGMAASAAHVAWSRREWSARHPAGMARAWGILPSGPPALGASGSVNAVVLLDTLLFPWRIIYVNLIIPMPAIVLGALPESQTADVSSLLMRHMLAGGLVLMRDAWGAWDSGGTGRGGVAHAGHVGGAAVGAAAWAALQLRTRRRW